MSTLGRTGLTALVGDALSAEYVLVNKDGSAVSTESAIPVGDGGSSVVFRALYRDRLQRALKVVIPRDDLLLASDLDRFVESYENEVAQLAKLSHEHVSKITDFGFVELSGQKYPYIATEFIEGEPLAEFAARTETSGRDLIAILDQILDAVSYMHRNGVMHCDLKSENILVRRGTTDTNTQPNATVVDLGASRYFPEPGQADDSELMYFYSTPKYVLPALQLVLSNRTGNRISRKQFRAYFPQQDLYSFGIVLGDLLESDPVRNKISKDVGRQYVDALRALVARLTSATPRADGAFTDAAQVKEALNRIAPGSVSALGIPELSLVPHRGVVIPSLLGRVNTSTRVDDFISHPFFQRLHNLPQLDLLQYVFPGATHSRFVHALHTYDLTRQALLHLLGDWRFRLEVTPADIEATLFAAIASQLGHYHFLHMFEDFLAARNTDQVIRNAGLLTDEEVADAALGGHDTSLGRYFQGITDTRGRSISVLLASTGVEWAEIQRRTKSPANALEGLLAALLSSPVDVEKLSYLYDDSNAAGVPFGRAVSGAPIFEELLLPHPEDWQRRSPTNKVALGVRERAISYLEHGILARYWNIQTAYWNRTNRAVQAMIKFQIRELIIAGELNFEEYLRETLHLSADGALRWLNSKFEGARSKGSIRGDIVNPIEPLLQSERALYKRLVTISGQSRIRGRENDQNVFETTRGMSPLKDEEILDTVRQALTVVYPGLEIKKGELLLDLPRPRREEAGGQVLVYTDNGAEFMGELFAISPFLENHRESFELHVKRMRVFVAPRVFDELAKSGKTNSAYDATLKALREAWGQ